MTRPVIPAFRAKHHIIAHARTAAANSSAALRERFPKEVARIEAEAEIKAAVKAEAKAITVAVQQERERMAAIDAIAGRYDPALVHEAKYDDPCTAAELAERAKLPKNRMRAARNRVKPLFDGERK